MRLIGNLPDQVEAETFADYLFTKGIQTQLEPEDGRMEIWIKDEDQVAAAIEELQLFRQNPQDSQYTRATSRARELQLQEIKKRRQLARNTVIVAGGKVPRNHTLTVALIVISGLVAILTEFGSEASLTRATFRALAFNAVANPDARRVWDANQQNPDALGIRLASVLRGEVWRVVTPIFLHAGIFHLIFNMYFLYLFGSQIEHRYGTFWFGMIVLVSAAVSNFVQCTVPINMGGAGPGFVGDYLIINLKGMSGVVYGLFGFILMRMSYDKASGLYIPQSTVAILLIWMVFCMTPVASETFQLNVANWAHVIGFLCGLIAGYWPVIFPKRPVAIRQR